MVVVGAGFGGIGMAVALRRAGFDDFVITEEGDDVGGVWRENTYPGCACDVPSHLYSFSFDPYRGTRSRYPGQPDILAYLQQVARRHDLYGRLRTRTRIVSATYCDETGCWELATESGATLRTEVVVFATGQLHRPFTPDIPGLDRFAGVTFHTARWRHGVEFDGRDVAVIGTGSSAAQLLPHVAEVARGVRVYQRTPHWILPKPAREFGALTHAALSLPGGHRLYRTALSHGADALLAPMMRRGWSARPAEWVARAHLRRSVQDPRLRAAVTPRYPIGTKRILFDNGFYRALARPTVELVTDPIVRLTPTGIDTADGTHRPADIVVFATGFRAADFLAPLTVRGRGGRLLAEDWAGGADAFLGLAVPGYPNAFLIAGPNTFNPAGSNPGMKEIQIDYILRCLRWRAQIGAPAVEVRADAAAAYRRWLDEALTRTVWPATHQPSWYKHANGCVTNPWPASARSFARMLEHPPAQAFRPLYLAEEAQSS
nr:NAD(P)/FAD-dependent oxidoreductase [Nocardia transvalensis]